MSEIPTELYYTDSHEWVRLGQDGLVVVGITHHAQDALGDVVFVELPEPDAVLKAGEEAGVVESVKAASDVYAPLAGTVVEVNQILDDAPETVNQDPYGDGWFYKLRPDSPGGVDALLGAEAYAAICEQEAH